MQTRTGINRVANFYAGEFAGVQAVASELVDRFEYDELGRRIKRTDALNGVSATWYDAQDRVKQTRTAEGFLTRYEYRYVDAGAAGEDAIFGAGGRSVGGYVLTTSGPDGLQQIDRFDPFNNKSSRVDLGGNRYQYRYNHAGLLEGQTSSRGQNIVYKYVGNGLVESIRDLTEGTLTQYAYDDAGNRIREMYGQLGADKITAGLVYQSSALQYDELGRLARVSDVLGGDEGNSQKSHLIRHEYDAVGNRRAVIALYWDPVTRSFLQRDDNWYTYDEANRFKTTMGSLIGARGAADTKIDLGARGKFVDYDKAGQRSSVQHADGKQEEYRYSSDGYLEEVYVNGLRGALRRVDALGRTVQYREWVPGGTVVRQTKLSSYSIDGRLLQEVVSDTEDSNGTTRYFYYSAGKNNDQGQTSQYAAGALARTEQISAPKEGTATTTRTYYSYEYLDTAKKKEIKVQGAADGVANWAPGFSRMVYNVNGHLMEAGSTDGRRLLYYSNAEGLTLLRRELLDGVDTGLRREYFFANGRQVGDVSTDPRDREQRRSYAEELAQPLTQSGKAQDRYRNLRPITSVDFDQNYEPINSRYPAAVPGSYTVQRGDTLQGIARALWGDGAMWYLIAEANGLLLDATTELPAKLVLSIPNKVTNIHNNASTFRVYNPGEAMGHVDPTLPDPPPPPDDEGCGFVGDLIMLAVAVAVTVYMGPGAGGSVLEFAAAAAAGSAASQAVGIAIGHIDRFDWNAVAQAALTGAVTAGVNAGLKDLAKAGVLGETVGSWVQSSTSWQGAAIRATAGTAVNMAIRGEWNWRAVAASAVSAGAGAAVGEQLASVLGNTDGARIATSALSAVAGGWASSQVLGLNRQQTMAVVGQGFVQGLGSAIGESFASPGRQGDGPWSARDYRNGSDVESDLAMATNRGYAGGQQWAADLAARRGGVPSAWPRGAAAQTPEDSLGLGDLDAFDATPSAIRLGANRWIDASGTIRNGRVEMRALVERGLYQNTDGDWLHAASTGIAPVGNIDSSNYVLADLPSAYQSKHGAVRAAWDQAGNGFMHVPQANGSYLLLSPPDGYSVPSLASFQLRAAGRGVVDTLAEVPAGLADTALAIGDGYRMTWDALSGGSDIQPWSNLARASLAGQITTSSVLGGIVNMSPVGVLGNAASGDYYAAGRSLGGTGVGLVSGPVGSRIVSSLNKLPVLGANVGSGIRLGAQWLGSGVATRIDRAINNALTISPVVELDGRIANALTIAERHDLKLGPVLAGHGSYELGSGMVRIPEGTSLTVYSKLGAVIDDRLGIAIESRGNLDQVYSKTYFSGDIAPNYTLHPPGELNVLSSSYRVARSTELVDILEPNMGSVDWAACTYNPRAPGAGLWFLETGVGYGTPNKLKGMITVYQGGK